MKKWNQTHFQWCFSKKHTGIATEFTDALPSKKVLLDRISISSTQNRSVEVLIWLEEGTSIQQKTWEQIYTRLRQTLPDVLQDNCDEELSPKDTPSFDWLIAIPKGETFCEFAIDLGYKILIGLGIHCKKKELPKFEFNQVTYVSLHKTWVPIEDYYWDRIVLALEQTGRIR